MKSFIILLLFILAQNLLAISQPNIPTMPHIPDISKKLNKQPAKTEKKKIVYHKYKVKVILNKGSQSSGNIKIPQDYITITQKENDFVFKKKLEIKKIKRIEALMWQGSKIKSKKASKDSIKHFFYPVKWAIVTESGKYIVYNGRIKVFEQFILTGTLGKAMVYSVFYDYWKVKDQGGVWLNSKSKKYKHNHLNPNPLTLKEIQFKHKKN